MTFFLQTLEELPPSWASGSNEPSFSILFTDRAAVFMMTELILIWTHQSGLLRMVRSSLAIHKYPQRCFFNVASDGKSESLIIAVLQFAM